MSDIQSHEKEKAKTDTNIVKYWYLIGLLVGLIPSLALYFLLGVDTVAGLYAICVGPLGITCGMVGAYIGKRSNKSIWIFAVLGTILGAGVSFALAVASCVFCM